MYVCGCKCGYGLCVCDRDKKVERETRGSQGGKKERSSQENFIKLAK